MGWARLTRPRSARAGTVVWLKLVCTGLKSIWLIIQTCFWSLLFDRYVMYENTFLVCWVCGWVCDRVGRFVAGSNGNIYNSAPTGLGWGWDWDLQKLTKKNKGTIIAKCNDSSLKGNTIYVISVWQLEFTEDEMIQML